MERVITEQGLNGLLKFCQVRMKKAVLHGYVGFYMKFGGLFKKFSTNVTKFRLGSRNINTH